MADGVEIPREAYAQALLRSFHEWRMAAFPVEASLEGRTEYDETYSGLTPADCDRRIESLAYYRKELESVDPAAVSPATALAFEALKGEIDRLTREQQELAAGLGFRPDTIAAGLRVLLRTPADARSGRALAARLREATPALKHVPDAAKLLDEIETWVGTLQDEQARSRCMQALKTARGTQ
ncbi:MAG TPA: hypothetical protein VI643_07685 [Planctomycetota bacterium]|nr:hypothetical protein [Planctomycetota bacterium]